MALFLNLETCRPAQMNGHVCQALDFMHINNHALGERYQLMSSSDRSFGSFGIVQIATVARMPVRPISLSIYQSNARSYSRLFSMLNVEVLVAVDGLCCSSLKCRMCATELSPGMRSLGEPVYCKEGCYWAQKIPAHLPNILVQRRLLRTISSIVVF